MAEEEKSYAGMTRRSLCLGLGGGAVLLAMGGLKALPAEAQVRAPGGQDEERMLSACIRCERCVEACPRNALRPAHIEEGLLGVRSPVANFDAGYCDFCEEANGGSPLCVQHCPTGAIKLDAGATAQNTILGKAVINTNWCLAFRLTGCRFCYDACPWEAIELDSDQRPYVIADKCNGCGACQSVCVSLQEGSLSGNLSGETGATERAIVVVPMSEFEG